jgi:hypothetical protein
MRHVPRHTSAHDSSWNHGRSLDQKRLVQQMERKRELRPLAVWWNLPERAAFHAGIKARHCGQASAALCRQLAVRLVRRWNERTRRTLAVTPVVMRMAGHVVRVNRRRIAGDMGRYRFRRMGRRVARLTALGRFRMSMMRTAAHHKMDQEHCSGYMVHKPGHEPLRTEWRRNDPIVTNYLSTISVRRGRVTPDFAVRCRGWCDICHNRGMASHPPAPDAVPCGRGRPNNS